MIRTVAIVVTGILILGAFVEPNLPIDQQDHFGWISGEVRNILDSSVVRKAEIKILKQIVDRLANGTYSVRSVDEAVPLGITVRTDRQGKFVVNVPLEKGAPNFFVVIAQAKGYEKVIRMLTEVKSRDTTKIGFELVPSRLTPEQRDRIDRMLEERKRRTD